MTLTGVAARTPDGHRLFHELTLAFGRERTGVVGRNGVGKTTLLDLMSGRLRPAEGTVSVNVRLGRLDQGREPTPGQTVADLLGVAPALAVIARVLAGQGDEHDLAAADWSLESRVAEALADVGLAALPLDVSADALSGGEATRVGLAGLLLDRPDLLLLDEPTNHLDAQGRAAVTDLLTAWRGGAVVVSHDRDLLRRMDRIIEISQLSVTVHGGGWDLYVQRRDAERQAADRDLHTAERGVAEAAREARQAVERKARRDRAGRAFAARRSEPRILLGAMAERAENSGAQQRHLAERRRIETEAALTQARARIERLRALAPPLPSTGLPAGRAVLSLDAAGWTAPGGKAALRPVSLDLTGPERVAVVGPNGSGKSTLLRLMAGDLQPTQGTIRRHVRIARLDQDAAILQPHETLLEAWRRLNPRGDHNQAHAALARFLFRNAAAHQRVGTLSGGERLRAALACVMTGPEPPQLLLLDEPTNHLDLEAVEAIETALAAWDGALVVVSHDEDFLQAAGIERRLTLAAA